MTFVFSQVLPISGWHQFHARSHPICPIVVGGNATAHLGHVFVMSYRQSPHDHWFRLVSTSSHDSPKPVDLRWQPSDMAWTSTPRRLRHGGPASPTLVQQLRLGSVCIPTSRSASVLASMASSHLVGRGPTRQGRGWFECFVPLEDVASGGHFPRCHLAVAAARQPDVAAAAREPLIGAMAFGPNEAW